ncbi:hypothetical protein H257_05690 [Aphanomyces astaci]|uniref:Uncharacterized protein n=1 Tax=Aphanomyces astaci TaxID=112090 RepID=W4GN36_APHAT|nr:hypothetical protein H257_05690 [Aphanomyces astaci]ETV81072.1 hypothetical protein H257_05690 [Aphanomyces astaci]|eukprot:XP_009828930.1 hypothetical protein H257_05690 [Aphanomyces astaci]
MTSRFHAVVMVTLLLLSAHATVAQDTMCRTPATSCTYGYRCTYYTHHPDSSATSVRQCSCECVSDNPPNDGPVLRRPCSVDAQCPHGQVCFDGDSWAGFCLTHHAKPSSSDKQAKSGGLRRAAPLSTANHQLTESLKSTTHPNTQVGNGPRKADTKLKKAACSNSQTAYIAACSVVAGVVAGAIGTATVLVQWVLPRARTL